MFIRLNSADFVNINTVEYFRVCTDNRKLTEIGLISGVRVTSTETPEQVMVLIEQARFKHDQRIYGIVRDVSQFLELCVRVAQDH